MFIEIISYWMPKILKNDDLMICYKLSISDVVKCAWISLPGYLFLFWHFGITTLKNSLSERLQWRYAWDQPFPVPIPAKERFKSRFHPDYAPNLVLNLSGSWPYLTSILVLLLSRFHPGLAPDPVPALSRFYRGSALVLMLSWFYPRLIKNPSRFNPTCRSDRFQSDFIGIRHLS